MLHLRSRLLPLLRATCGTSTSASPLPLRHLLLSSAPAASFSALHLSRRLLLSTATSTVFSVEEYLVDTCGLSAAQAVKASKKLSHLKSATNPDAVVALLSGVGLSRAEIAAVEYLVETCGFSAAQAVKASKKLSHLKSATNPDAVVALLSGVGLSRAEIAAVVASDPLLLCAKADTIGPRVASLRDRVGLSDPQIGSLLLAGGAAGLRSGDIASRLEFWIQFHGSFETLLKTLKGNYSILTTDIEKVIKPNIALLRKCGLTVCDIVKMAGQAGWLLTFNPKKLEAVVQRADELGVPRTSSIFKYTLGVTACITEGKATARMKFLSSTLGCPMDTLRSAVCRVPQILGLSEENLRSKIEFLVNKVALKPNYILQRPVLLALSLGKRLAPRHYVLQVLAVKGLIKNDVDFYRSVCLVEEHFVARYIDPHENAVPGLADAYASVRAGKLPAQSKCNLNHQYVLMAAGPSANSLPIQPWHVEAQGWPSLLEAFYENDKLFVENLVCIAEYISQGLLSEDVAERLQAFWCKQIEEYIIIEFFKFMRNPLSWISLDGYDLNSNRTSHMVQISISRKLVPF
uniref:Uncharacterized protein n=1 Tax=Oryza brachyantha TaxID=4533 RepID=J3N6P7_ORYBR